MEARRPQNTGQGISPASLRCADQARFVVFDRLTSPIRSAILAAVPEVVFTAHLRRHLDCPDRTVEGDSVREILEALFIETPKLRSYLLDDNGVLRRHVNIFIDGESLKDRRRQTDAVTPSSSIYVMQALSGG